MGLLSPQVPESLPSFLIWLYVIWFYHFLSRKFLAEGRAGGFRIAGLTLLEKIGRVRSAIGYSARNDSGAKFALKILRNVGKNVIFTRDAFLREGRFVSRLSHPGYRESVANG